MRFSDFPLRVWRPVGLPFNRVLVAKTTHLGDLVISLPMATALKRRDPDCTVIFLTNSKTVDLARSCPDIDEVYAAPDSEDALTALLASLRVDIFIQVNNSRTVAAAAYRAGIPVRIGSLYRFYNLRRCTHLVANSRAFLGLNKRQLDLEYLLPLGIEITGLQEVIALYRLVPRPVSTPEALHPQRYAQGRRSIVLSPALTTARAHQWPLASYSALIDSLDPERFHWFICGLESERAQLSPLLSRHAGAPNVTDLVGRLALSDFMGFLAGCDGLIGGSTGPVHLAAALGIRTLGLFQSRRSDLDRWYPVGPASAAIHSDVPCQGERQMARRVGAGTCPCIEAIRPETVAQHVLGWFPAETHTGEKKAALNSARHQKTTPG